MEQAVQDRIEEVVPSQNGIERFPRRTKWTTEEHFDNSGNLRSCYLPDYDACRMDREDCLVLP
jgi:hypothetical protein